MAVRRRRGAELEAAVLAAVRDEVARTGYTNLTYEGVAAAAETGKAVLYRRWPTKAEMVLAAFAADGQIAEMGNVDTGSLAGDLTEAMTRGRELLDARRDVLLGLHADVDSKSVDLFGTLFAGRIATTFGGIVERARRRGDLGDLPVPQRVLEVPIVMLRHEVLLRGRVTDNDLDEMIRMCIIPLFGAVSGRAVPCEKPPV